MNADKVVKFDKNGHFLLEWGSTGKNKGEFKAPSDLAVDRTDNVYVADFHNARIQKFDSGGIYLAEWKIRNVRSVSVDSSDNVYATAREDNRVSKYTKDGKLITQWNVEQAGPITVSDDGRVYVISARQERKGKLQRLMRTVRLGPPLRLTPDYRILEFSPTGKTQ